jgi:hypothetical protein
MSNNYIVIGIILSVFIIIWGFVNYLNISPFEQSVWILTSATITNIENKNKKRIVKYNYKLNDLEYSATISLDDDKDISESDSILPIYYYYKNPQLSFIKKPNEGVYTIAFGILLLLLCVLLFMKEKNEEREIDSLTNKIFTV